MKSEMIAEFRKGFKPVHPTAPPGPLDADYRASGTVQTGRRPLQFAPQGTAGKLQFDVNMAACKWRRR